MISASVTAAIAPPVRRTTSRAYQPSAGLPIASDLAIVAGLTGRTWSLPSANAVATGEQPCAWAPEIRTSPPPSTRPSSASSRKPLSIFVSWLPEAIGDDDVVRELPAELLGDLEGQRLRAFRVVGPDVDVDERPGRELARQLGAEAVHVVVAAVDGDRGARRRPPS